MRRARCITACTAAGLWLFPLLIHAQGPGPQPRALTLAEAREIARRHSPELAAARHALEAEAGRERQAGAWPNPTLAYGREQTSRDGFSNAQDVISLDQPLEIGGQRAARRRAAELTRMAAEAEAEGVRARIDAEVTRAYATGLAAERRARLAEEAADAFESAVRTSEARLAGGDVSGYEHRRLRLEAVRYAATRLQAITARDSAVDALIGLMGRTDSAGPLQLADTLPLSPLGPSMDSLVALALVRRPELRALRLQAEAGTAQARLASAERIPTPVVSAGYKHERQSDGRRLDGFVAGLSVPLPLWDRRGGATSAARADAARARSEVEAAERRTASEVRAAFMAHETLAAQLRDLADQLERDADKARRAAQAAYGEGEITLLEWLDAVRAYQEAEALYTGLWAEYITRRAALERVTGATLF